MFLGLIIGISIGFAAGNIWFHLCLIKHVKKGMLEDYRGQRYSVRKIGDEGEMG
jgi:hypothetical protein